MLNQWPSLKNFIEAGLAEISNDLCEQRMKPILATITLTVLLQAVCVVVD